MKRSIPIIATVLEPVRRLNTISLETSVKNLTDPTSFVRSYQMMLD